MMIVVICETKSVHDKQTNHPTCWEVVHPEEAATKRWILEEKRVFVKDSY
jgi:hypothetical protein